eukprot:1148048-Pelagomonas_calceolata.AAC.13
MLIKVQADSTRHSTFGSHYFELQPPLTGTVPVRHLHRTSCAATTRWKFQEASCVHERSAMSCAGRMDKEANRKGLPYPAHSPTPVGRWTSDE